MVGLTDIERKVLDWLNSHTANGGWFSARRIADYAGVLGHLSNRSKAGVMTGILKRLRAAGYVEMDFSDRPIIWRRKQ